MAAPGRFPLLARPVQVGAINAKNAVFMSSLTRNRSPGTVPNEHNVKYYAQRAQNGGAGLIFGEGVLITRQGSEWPDAPGLWDEEHAEGWKKVVDAVHAEGTPIIAQLWHIGRVAHPDMDEQKKAGRPVYAPSAVGARGGKFRLLEGEPGYVTPTAASKENIQEIINQFEHAAKMAKIAGFDGVEFHSANGYLGEQFLSDVSNVRDDEYGGSIENRTRFGLEVVKKLIGVYGADRVGIKLSPCGGYNDQYFTSPESLVDTFKYYIQELDKLKIAYMQITQYNAYGDVKFDGKPQGYDHDVVATYKDLLKNAAFIANCGYDGAKAEKEVEERGVKAVSFGQAFIANPDYYRRIQENLDTNQVDYPSMYNIIDGDAGKGYHDYPFATARL